MQLRTVKFTFDPGTKPVSAEDVVRALKTVLGSAGDLADWQIKRMSLASPLTIEARCAPSVYKPLATFARKMNAVTRGRKPRGGLVGSQAKLLDAVDFITKGSFGAVAIAPSQVKPIRVNQTVVDQARKLTGQHLPSLMVHPRQQMGQLRGYLEQITAPRGKRPRFAIRDRVSGERILCHIRETSSELFATAVKALTKRVVVTGLIHYGDQSRPSSIDAALIEPLDEHVIPFDKLPRIGLTDDGNAVGYIRRLRDG